MKRLPFYPLLLSLFVLVSNTGLIMAALSGFELAVVPSPPPPECYDDRPGQPPLALVSPFGPLRLLSLFLLSLSSVLGVSELSLGGCVSSLSLVLAEFP